MIGLLIVITLGVYFGIKLAQPGEDVAPKPVGRFLDGFLTFLSIGIVAFVVCCALFGFIVMAMPAANAGGLPGFAQQGWDPPGWENTPTDAIAIRQLPDAMLGPWCPATVPPGNDYVRGTNAQMQTDPACILIAPDGYRGIEDACEFMSVKHWSDVYLVRMRCSEGEDLFLPTSSTFQIIDGKLSVKEQEQTHGR